VNHPYGAEGTVLAPLTSGVFAALRAVAGDVAAANLTGVAVLAALGGAAAWTARGLGLGWAAAATAGVAMLAARYPVYALGEASVVGLTGVPVVVGLGALVRGRRGLVALCAGLTALEYPYLVPVLPGLALLRGARDRDWRWAVTAGVALGLAWLGTRFVGRGQISDFQLHPWSKIEFLGRLYPVVEEAKARALALDLLRPGEVLWRLSARPEDPAGGRDYLGLSLVLLGAIGWRRSGPWLLLAAIAAVLATGSDWGGVPAPFCWLNLLASRVVRGLTQPTRFLLLANAALAVAAAFGVERLGRWRAAGLGLVLVDALLLGGLSLRLPTLPLPAADCARDLQGRSGVIVWPWDARTNADASLQTRFWQMEHGRPAATFGVGSWHLGENTRALDALGRAGLREGAPLPTAALLGLGYDTVIVDLSAASAVAGLGAPSRRCAGADVYFLDGTGGGPSPARR
jgi:hypothetical protein